MATTVLRPLPNFDLLPKNPRPLLIKYEETKVNVEITIETKVEPNSAQTDRWSKVAAGEMKEYQDILHDTVAKVTAKWDKLALGDMKKEAAELTRSVNNALKPMEGALTAAVEQQIKREEQGNKNLFEAKVVTVVKAGHMVITIAANAASVVATGGTNVAGWLKLAKSIVDLAKLVYDACKDEPKLRAEFLEAIGAYNSRKQVLWNQEQKATDFKHKLKFYVNKTWKSVKSMADKAEAARKKYRNEITSITQHVDGIGEKRDQLQKELNASGQLNAKDIGRGKEMIDLGTQVKGMNAHILSCQKFLDDMAYLLTESGVTVDDRTVVQKIKQLDGFKDIAASAKELRSTATELHGLIEKLAG